jgi:hypothetical protein
MDSTRTMAFGYGYLAHLAADTVAHNYYVPNMLHAAPAGGKLSHVMVEYYADQAVAWDRQEAGGLLAGQLHAADPHLLAAVGHRKKVPFLLKKRLFRGSILMGNGRRTERRMQFARHVLPLRAFDDYLTRMLDLSLSLVVDALNDPMTATAAAHDPIGADNLALVKGIRPRQLAESTTLFPSVLAFPMGHDLQEHLDRAPAGSLRTPLRTESAKDRGYTFLQE